MLRYLCLCCCLTAVFAAELPDKAAIAASHATETMVVSRVANRFVAGDVDLDGNDGNVQEGADPNGMLAYMKLTYSFVSATPSAGNTQWFMFYVDGTAQKTTGSLPVSDSHYVRAADTTGIVVWNNWRGVKIREEIRPVSLGSIPGQIEQLRYKFVMKPVDGVSHSCGAMVFFDTMINTNDGAPISTAFGYSATSNIYYAPDVPTIWRAYEVAYPPSASEMQALGILAGFEATMPDVFWYGAWPSASGLNWPTAPWATLVGATYTDSGVMIKWNERTIAAGDSVVFITYYGIGNFSSTEVSLNHVPPTILPDCDGTFIPDTTHFNFVITNGGISRICNITAQITGTGMTFTGMPNPVNIDTLAGYGGSYLLDWGVIFNPSVWGTTQQYIITLTFDNCFGTDSTIVDTFSVDIPYPSNIRVSITATDTMLCVGDTIQLDGTITGAVPPVTISWAPGYAISDVFVEDPFVFPEVSNFYYLTVTDANGCTRNANIFIRVSDTYVEAGEDATVCIGDSVRLGSFPTALGSFAPYTYSWTPTTGLSGSATANPYAKPTVPTWYHLEVHDAAGCVKTDSVFVDVSQKPTAHVIYPPTCNLITSCNPPAFRFAINDPEHAINPTSFSASINGTVFSWGSPALSYLDSILTVTAPTAFAHGSVVVTTLATYSDSDRCTGTAVTCTVTVDSRPPDAAMTAPLPGASTLNPSPIIAIDISDIPAGIDISSFDHITVTLNGTAVSGFTHTWTPPTLRLSGFDFSEGGIVRVCLDSLRDTPDLCAPNDTTICWTFTVVVGNVIAYPENPVDSAFTACNPQNIIVHLAGSANPVDTNSIVMNVDGVRYRIDSPLLSYNPTTEQLIFNPGASFWVDSDHVCVSVWATDIYGGAMDDSLHFCFTVDYAPPVISAIVPAIGSTVTTLYPNFSFHIADAVTGVESLRVTIEGTTTLTPTSPCVTYTAGNFSFNAVCAGLSYPMGTVVDICVDAWDDPDLCGPNHLDTCFSFTVSMLCSLEANAGRDTSICTLTELTLGGVPAATRGTPPFSYEWSLGGAVVSTSPNPMLTPSSGVYVLEVIDSFGCVDIDSVTIDVHDCAGPIVTVVHPENATWSSCDVDTIILRIEDPNGIDASSIELTVSGVTYTVGSPELTWTSPFLYFVPSTPFADGATVTFALTACTDMLGNPFEGGVHVTSYRIDRSAPIIFNINPPLGTTVTIPRPIISFYLADYGSGIDDLSVEVWLGEMHHIYGDSCLIVETDPMGLHVTIDTNCVLAHGCEDLRLFVRAQDTTDYCDDNTLDTGWTYLVDCEPPVCTVVFPPESSWFSCSRDSIVARIIDTAPGLNVTTLSISATDGAGYSETAHWGDASLSFATATGTLTWVPITPFPTSGTMTIRVFTEDLLGNVNVLDWSFFLDRVGPEVSYISPECGSIVSSISPDIFIVATDLGCGEITATAEIDGISYTDIVTSADTLRINPASRPIFAGGDVIEVCWTLIDCADDVCAANSTDTCCTFDVPAGGPTCYIRNPSSDSIFVACDAYAVHMTVFDIDGLLTDSIRVGLEIDGTPMTLDLTSPTLTHTVFPDSVTITWTPSSIVDGTEVTIWLESAYDSLFNALSRTDRRNFIFDLTPPTFSTLSPITGSTVSSTSPDICVDINDALSGVDVSSIVFVVEGTTFTVPHAAIDVTGSRWCFSPSVASMFFSGGQEVNIVVRAADSPDTCVANIDSVTWNFFIESGGPAVDFVRPIDSAFVACVPDSMIFTATDANGCNISSLGMVLRAADDSTYLTAASTGVALTSSAGGETLRVAVAIPSALEEGSAISLCVVALDDLLGNSFGSARCLNFFVDATPPAFATIHPAAGEVIEETAPHVAVQITDGGAGIDINATEITVNGQTFTYDSGCITYFATGDSLIFAPEACAIMWSGGDTINFCVHLADLSDTSFCGTNIIDTCFEFSVASGAPVVTVLVPFEGAAVACEPETIIVSLVDANGVDAATIAVSYDGVQFGLTDSRLSFDGTTLRFVPATVSPSGSVHTFCVVAAADVLGNEIAAPICVNFAVDYEPPAVQMLTPTDGAMVSDTHQDIVLQIDDMPAGVDTVSFSASIYGSTFGASNFIWTPTAGGFAARFLPENNGLTFAPGETVRVSVTVRDTVDFCVSNGTTVAFDFLIEPQTGCLLHINPFTPNGDGINDTELFDYPKMFSTAAELIIFDIRGREVYRRDMGPITGLADTETRRWNGKDNSGNSLPQGVYLYIIRAGDEVVCEGTVTIAR